MAPKKKGGILIDKRCFTKADSKHSNMTKIYLKVEMVAL